MISGDDIRAIARLIHPWRRIAGRHGPRSNPAYYRAVAEATGYAEATVRAMLHSGGTAPFWRALSRYLREQATLYLSWAERLDAAAAEQEARNASIAGFPQVAYRDGPDAPARCGRPLKSRAKIT